MGNRQISRIISGQATADGAGVRLRRYIGSAELDHIDPFLLLDFFESDNPDDYIAGFPSHPHRGFETVTYLLAGKVRHEDSACLLYTSPSPRDRTRSRMPSSA